MRHRVSGYHLNRDTEHRKAMWRNMAISVLTHGQITTTVPKAKSVQPFVEKLISLARKGDLAARRRVISQIGDPIMITHDDDENVDRNRYGEVIGGPRLVKKLFEEIGPKYADRDGGYTRVVRLGKHRLGDGSDLCVLQLVGEEEGPQVSGQYSRRRDKANKRMEFAAKLRRGEKDAEEAPPPAEEAEATTAVAEEETSEQSQPESDKEAGKE